MQAEKGLQLVQHLGLWIKMVIFQQHMTVSVTNLQKLFESDDWAHLSAAGHRFNSGDDKSEVLNRRERFLPADSARYYIWSQSVPGEVFVFKEQEEFPELALVLLHQSVTTNLQVWEREHVNSTQCLCFLTVLYSIHRVSN